MSHSVLPSGVHFDEVRARLAAGLARPLPGADAQRRLAPVPHRPWPHDFDRSTIRHAAGLLLVFPIEERAHVVLTVRADTLGRHGGQVSLPGGVVEPGETIQQAALREAYEEVSVPVSLVRPLGALTPVDIPVSGFRLHPIVGEATARPVLRPSHGEVARVLEIPLSDLLAPATFIWRTLERDGEPIAVPTFATHGTHIWGATAMVVAEFLALLGWTGPPTDQSHDR